jgi:predicted urease superfamily metal-dependent hydrolase
MSLEEIKDELSFLATTITYIGYDPNRPSDAEAIATVCQKIIQLIEYIEQKDSVPDMTDEDYEAIYGWGGQG